MIMFKILNPKEFALGVFLDIDGAFDNASLGSMDVASGERRAVSMGWFKPCLGGLMPCFAVESFELRSGESVPGCS
jgi:hypothetical protein